MDPQPALRIADRAIKPKWVERFFGGIDEQQLQLIRFALGYVPMEPDAETIAELIERYEKGRVRLYTLSIDGKISAACFFEVQVYPLGNNLHCNAIVAVQRVGRLVQTDLPVLEEIAGQLGCSSMSFETVRPGVLRAAIANGWKASSVVCRKALNREHVERCLGS